MNQPDGKLNLKTQNVLVRYMEKLQEFPEPVRPVVDMLTEFIADVFTRPVSGTNDIEYFFSAYFSDQMLNKLAGDTVEAIWYPSVKEGLTFQNIAVKPDVFGRHYQIVMVEEFIVGDTLRYTDEALIESGAIVCGHFDVVNDRILWHHARQR